MYYQGIRLGWVKGIPGIEEMPVEAFTQIVNQLNPRAILFEYDRDKRLETNMAVLSLLAQYAPQGVPVALKIAVSQMSSEWARVINQIPLQPVAPPMPQQVPPGDGPRKPNLPPGGAAMSTPLAGVLNGQR